MPQFYQTGMGRSFYENTVPQIARQLKVIGDEMREQSELKHKELQLKERELELKERELNLKERELQLLKMKISIM